MYSKYLKRILDFVLSLIGLTILFPVLLIIAMAIKIDSKGPVLFKQKRIGLHKTHFYILKFRSMKMSTPHDMPTHELENAEEYITKTGRFLRRTSMDELPQIINILLGHMSIVGPRPALWNQFDLIRQRDLYGANDIRPGLTGWAQINGRDAIGIADKARYDGEYVRRMSFLFDCRCILGTVSSVLRHDGVIEGAADKTKKEKA